MDGCFDLKGVLLFIRWFLHFVQTIGDKQFLHYVRTFTFRSDKWSLPVHKLCKNYQENNACNKYIHDRVNKDSTKRWHPSRTRWTKYHTCNLKWPRSGWPWDASVWTRDTLAGSRLSGDVWHILSKMLNTIREA